MTSLSERIQFLLDETGDTKSAMAKKAGVTLASLFGMLRGDSTGMRAVTAFNLSRRYGVRLEWLLFGRGEPFLDSPADEFPPVTKYIPLIPWERVGAFKEISMAEKQSFPQLPAVAQMSDGSFCVNVKGGAMEPQFQEGEVVFVDPAKKPENKSFVIAVTSDHKVLLRQLLTDGSEAFLVTINKDWPGERFVSLDENTEIVGVVTGKWVPL